MWHVDAFRTIREQAKQLPHSSGIKGGNSHHRVPIPWYDFTDNLSGREFY